MGAFSRGHGIILIYYLPINIKTMELHYTMPQDSHFPEQYISLGRKLISG